MQPVGPYFFIELNAELLAFCQAGVVLADVLQREQNAVVRPAIFVLQSVEQLGAIAMGLMLL